MFTCLHGPVTRYVSHASGMPGPFSPTTTSKETRVSNPSMHHGTCMPAICYEAHWSKSYNLCITCFLYPLVCSGRKPLPVMANEYLLIFNGVGGAVRFLVAGTIGQEERPPRGQLWMEQCLTSLKYWPI